MEVFMIFVLFPILSIVVGNENSIDIHWILQGKDISFSGFFVEFLGFAEAFQAKFQMASLSKSFFNSSMSEDPIKFPEKFFNHDLFPKEKTIVQSLLNKQISLDQIQTITWPTSRFIADPVVDEATIIESCQTKNESQGTRLTQHPTVKQLSRYSIIHDTTYNNTSVDSLLNCCVACSHHRYCLSYSYSSLDHTCHLHEVEAAAVTSPTPIPSTAVYYSNLSSHLPQPSQPQRQQPLHQSRPSSNRSPKPRVIILHGTTCAYQNTSILTHRDIHTIIIGRYMLERSPLDFPRSKVSMSLDEVMITYCMQYVDELWVPTIWHQEIFKGLFKRNGGGHQPYITVIGEAVDTTLFTPPIQQLEEEKKEVEVLPDGMVRQQLKQPSPFIFLSIFKWEYRKGWDLLLQAYWTAFLANNHTRDPVLLQIKTHLPSSDPYATTQSIKQRILRFAYSLYPELLSHSGHDEADYEADYDQVLALLPPIQIIESMENSREDMKTMYSQASAFVLPTRGEGWGLPICEAMAMGLPVIVTNATGPLAYLTDENSYPIPIEKTLDDNEKPILDQFAYVKPNITALISLLKQVMINAKTTTIATEKGRKARETMQSPAFSSKSMVKIMSERIQFHADRRGWQY